MIERVFADKRIFLSRLGLSKSTHCIQIEPAVIKREWKNES